MGPGRRSRKEALVNGAEGADGAVGVDVRAKVRWSSHSVYLRRCLSRTSDAASHGREKRGVRAAVMQQVAMCLEDPLMTGLFRT